MQQLTKSIDTFKVMHIYTLSTDSARYIKHDGNNYSDSFHVLDQMCYMQVLYWILNIPLGIHIFVP